MHRPSDQAKLLFFALLRGTVSALAVSEPKVAAAGSVSLAIKHGCSSAAASPLATHHQQQPELCSNIQLRLARRTDVPSIQRCNLATLPENYNSQFYINHMRQWPDLCLVAEDINHPNTHNHNNNNHGRNDNQVNVDRPFGMGGSFPSLVGAGSMLGGGGGRSESNVVAYVLGKVEERPRPRFYQEGYQLGDGWEEEPDKRERFVGHVTSLAVLQPYRRQGLAAAMMKQLHFHLEEAHGAGAVGLHVRKSNQAACRLYQNRGYQIDLTIPGYYQDGEDAYFMKKPLPLLTSSQGLAMERQQKHQALKFPFLGRRPRRPWESGPLDLRLPRDLVAPDDDQQQQHQEEMAVDEQNSPGLLTGSM